MTTSRERLDAIYGVAAPPKGTVERKEFEKNLRENPSPLRQRLIHERFREALMLLEVQTYNGAELRAAQLLREFLVEYNDRSDKHGLYGLPLSFNILEAFFSYQPSRNFFELLNEHDHIC